MSPFPPLLLAFRLATAPPAPDRWFGEDKLRHFFLSFAAIGTAYAAARTAGLEPGPARAAAAAATAAAGVWKEHRDRRAGSRFSAKDLVWDGLGLGAGLALTAHVR